MIPSLCNSNLQLAKGPLQLMMRTDLFCSLRTSEIQLVACTKGLDHVTRMAVKHSMVSHRPTVFKFTLYIIRLHSLILHTQVIEMGRIKLYEKGYWINSFKIKMISQIIVWVKVVNSDIEFFSISCFLYEY